MLPSSLALGANRGPGSDAQPIKPVCEPGVQVRIWLSALLLYTI